MFWPNKNNGSEESVKKPECPFEVMKKGKVGSIQTHPVTGNHYLLGMTSHDDRCYLKKVTGLPIAA